MKIKLKKFKKVKSTNDTALKFIKKNISVPTIITSENQTNGRGRIGKKWTSNKGNLFISIFFKFNQKEINFKQFAILNAFLIKRVISKKISQKVNIKWPNDLLFNNQKFCGILQEVIRFNNYDYLIVGIGINISSSPKITNYPTTFLNNYTNKNLNRLELFKEIKLLYEKNLHSFGV